MERIDTDVSGFMQFCIIRENPCYPWFQVLNAFLTTDRTDKHGWFQDSMNSRDRRALCVSVKIRVIRGSMYLNAFLSTDGCRYDAIHCIHVLFEVPRMVGILVFTAFAGLPA